MNTCEDCRAPIRDGEKICGDCAAVREAGARWRAALREEYRGRRVAEALREANPHFEGALRESSDEARWLQARKELLK